THAVQHNGASSFAWLGTGDRREHRSGCLAMRIPVFALCLCFAACSAPEPVRPLPTQDQIGRLADGRQMTPVNQTLTPYGTFVDLPGLRPQAIAQSHDGRHLYVSGKTSELLVLDAVTGAIAQHVALPNDRQVAPAATGGTGNELRPDTSGQLSYTGLVVSADGRWIYLSNVRGSIKVFAVDQDGGVKPSHTLRLPAANAPRRDAEIPSGLVLSSDDRLLYVCANLSSQLLELDVQTGEVLRAFAVGVAPFDVVLVGARAFVSNWGGRRPGPDDLVGPAGRGTTVRV